MCVCVDLISSLLPLFPPFPPSFHPSMDGSGQYLREELIPYIYTQGFRSAFDSGLGLLRPMYYEFPEEDMAYRADMHGNFAQYFFGEDMIVSPIVRPADPENLMAWKEIWIPPGDWVDVSCWGRGYDMIWMMELSQSLNGWMDEWMMDEWTSQ